MIEKNFNFFFNPISKTKGIGPKIQKLFNEKKIESNIADLENKLMQGDLYSKNPESFYKYSKNLEENKYWPPVGRVDNVYGDKNLMCSCPSMDDFN